MLESKSFLIEIDKTTWAYQSSFLSLSLSTTYHHLSTDSHAPNYWLRGPLALWIINVLQRLSVEAIGWQTGAAPKIP